MKNLFLSCSSTGSKLFCIWGWCPMNVFAWRRKLLPFPKSKSKPKQGLERQEGSAERWSQHRKKIIHTNISPHPPPHMFLYPCTKPGLNWKSVTGILRASPRRVLLAGGVTRPNESREILRIVGERWCVCPQLGLSTQVWSKTQDLGEDLGAGNVRRGSCSSHQECGTGLSGTFPLLADSLSR